VASTYRKGGEMTPIGAVSCTIFAPAIEATDSWDELNDLEAAIDW